MASYSISYTETSVTFRVTGLTAGDHLWFYVRLDPDPGYSEADEFYTATGSSVTTTLYGLSEGTKYVANVRLNGSWIGAKTFTTRSSKPPRPSDWAWSSRVEAGAAIGLTAAEWNGFCARIEAFRAYAGLDSYGLTTVSPGTPISAAIVNEARSAISEIGGHGTLPAAAAKGAGISASIFIRLRDALNAVA